MISKLNEDELKQLYTTKIYYRKLFENKGIEPPLKYSNDGLPDVSIWSVELGTIIKCFFFFFLLNNNYLDRGVYLRVRFKYVKIYTDVLSVVYSLI